MSWIPLHVQSQYSILESSASTLALVAKANEFHLSSLALTDQGNMYGAVEFYKACKGAGIKPIIGAKLYVAPVSRLDKKRIPGVAPGYPIILLAKDKKGYQNLCKLTSIAHLEGFYYTPRIDKEILAQYSEGLICLSGALEGRVCSLILQEQEEELKRELQWYQGVFKNDYYLEVQRHVMKDEDIGDDGLEKEAWAYQNYLDHIVSQNKVGTKLKQISEKEGIPLVATNGCRYIEREDWRAQEILMNIQSGEPVEIWERDSFGNPKVRVLNPKRQILPSHELYFKSPAEMQTLFSDLPQALANTVEIANSCYVEIDFKTRYYPVFIPPHMENTSFTEEERVKEAAQFLRQLCEEGIKHRYTPEKIEKVQEKYPGKNPMQVIQDRLSYELELIISKGMGDYLLIVYDFIDWAKKKGIPVGPGRGSGAGSIILYLIGITDIEPLRFHLFFERFINPERISYPDIDVDICMERRAEVIEYTVRKYGKEKVAQIITFGTMKAKMAIKDVGRMLSIPLAKVNAIAKLVPEELNITIKKALEVDPDLRSQYESDPEVSELLNLAMKLEGSVRNTGIHAAGMIICGDALMEHIPLCASKDTDIAVTQFSMKPVEAVGMLKIDFLGLKTLTSIQNAVNAIRLSQGKEIDWVNLPLEDKTTFDLLNEGKTQGIFQLESGGMQDLARALHIDKFEEIIAVGALYRPGPMEMIPSFINRKHGKEPIDIDHPLMRDILAETYGIMVYQEQVMQMASLLANYSLGEGDVLRRAMGKKDREEMSRQREKFREGALQKGIDEQTSMRIFDKVEKFASYGFNKSHAAAYGYLTYVTAYLKANYPKEWMAALMTSDSGDLSKVTKVICECQEMNIAILPPDVNESAKEFVATPRGIRFSMMAIKGVGEGVVDAILEERTKRGFFRSLYDFFKRTDTRRVGKKVAEHLIEAGCFDFTHWPRQAMIESVDVMYEAAAREQKESARGVMNLFSLIDEGEADRFLTPPPVKEKVHKQKILKREKELLGFYLTGHPMDDYREMLHQLSCVSLSKLCELDNDSVCRAAFIIETVSIKLSAKSQKKFAVLMISDGFERLELPIWPDLYEEKSSLFVENQLLYALLQVERVEGSSKLQCRWVDDLTKVNEEMVKSCDLAYDRVKMQVKMSEFREKNAKKGDKMQKKEKVEPKKELPKKLLLKVDADEMRLSHVLALKELFRASSGTTSVQITFYKQEKKVASVHIDSNWGVQVSSQLEEKLRRFAPIKSLHLEG